MVSALDGDSILFGIQIPENETYFLDIYHIVTCLCYIQKRLLDRFYWSEQHFFILSFVRWMGFLHLTDK